MAGHNQATSGGKSCRMMTRFQSFTAADVHCPSWIFNMVYAGMARTLVSAPHSVLSGGFEQFRRSSLTGWDRETAPPNGSTSNDRCVAKQPTFHYCASLLVVGELSPLTKNSRFTTLRWVKRSSCTR